MNIKDEIGIFFYVEPNPGGTAPCYNPNCSKNPKYIDLDRDDKRIKKGTLRGQIGGAYYCRDCIPIVFAAIKKVFDPNLWAFK